MPRAFSSGALSIWSYADTSPPNFAAITLVNAAVSVVLPWSTWPIVPTFTCGFLRSNLAFDMSFSLFCVGAAPAAIHAVFTFIFNYARPWAWLSIPS
jgi:hypothetical protein